MGARYYSTVSLWSFCVPRPWVIELLGIRVGLFFFVHSTAGVYLFLACLLLLLS